MLKAQMLRSISQNFHVEPLLLFVLHVKYPSLPTSCSYAQLLKGKYTTPSRKVILLNLFPLAKMPKTKPRPVYPTC